MTLSYEKATRARRATANLIKTRKSPYWIAPVLWLSARFGAHVMPSLSCWKLVLASAIIQADSETSSPMTICSLSFTWHKKKHFHFWRCFFLANIHKSFMFWLSQALRLLARSCFSHRKRSDCVRALVFHVSRAPTASAPLFFSSEALRLWARPRFVCLRRSAA